MTGTPSSFQHMQTVAQRRVYPTPGSVTTRDIWTIESGCRRVRRPLQRTGVPYYMPKRVISET